MKDCNTIPYRYRSLRSILLIVFLASAIHCSQKVQPLSQQAMKRIFNNNQYFVVYVFQQINQNIMSVFQDYCVDHSLCAYLDKNNQLYESVRGFVGYPGEQYFLILDAPRQSKYVLGIKDNAVEYKEVFNFEADFTSQRLKPFYSSEQIPEEVYEPCRKLVGTNFDQFLTLKSPIKVVFLYTQQTSCQICGQMLRGFADIAQKLYRDDVVAFGYFDIFKNDHATITYEVAPYFLVFKQGQEQPFGIEGQKFAQLQNAIVNIIAEHIYPNYRKQGDQRQIGIQDLTEVNSEYLQQIDFDEQQQYRGKNFQL